MCSQPIPANMSLAERQNSITERSGSAACGSMWSGEQKLSRCYPCSKRGADHEWVRTMPLEDRVAADTIRVPKRLSSRARGSQKRSSGEFSEELISDDAGAPMKTATPSSVHSHLIVTDLISALLKGKVISVNDGTGASAKCTVRLNAKLTSLSLSFEGVIVARTILLQEVGSIYFGQESKENIVNNDAAAGKMCVTLVLESGEMANFIFDSGDERDAFAYCLTMFVADSPPPYDILAGDNDSVDDWQRPMRSMDDRAACGLCY